MQPSDKIRLYRSLFRGRDDVFAKRSPTTGSYFPEHTLNWDEFNAHKANGGRMATFKNKKLTPLTDEIILKHLTGQITVGIYPIIEDNTSYFLTADFDKENWLEDCRNYQAEMAKLGLSSYIERSRSVNGGHVWVFFEDSYPCHLSEYENSSPSGVAAQGSVVSCVVNDDFEESSLAVVFVVREHPNGKNVNIVVYLCDIFCLGVKDVSLFPSSNERTMSSMQDRYMLDFDVIDYQDARDLVLGCVAYAQSLGFEPHPDWERGKGFIGFDKPYNSKHYTYGRDEKPLYVAGPHDNQAKILETLHKNCGEGNFDYFFDGG